MFRCPYCDTGGICGCSNRTTTRWVENTVVYRFQFVDPHNDVHDCPAPEHYAAGQTFGDQLQTLKGRFWVFKQSVQGSKYMDIEQEDVPVIQQLLKDIQQENKVPCFVGKLVEDIKRLRGQVRKLVTGK